MILTSAISGYQFLQDVAEDFRVAIDIFGFGLRAHESHVVERSEENAAIHRVEMKETFQFEIHGVVGVGAVARRLLSEEILCATAEARNMPGNAKIFDAFAHASRPAFR